jgi:repressor LexA
LTNFAVIAQMSNMANLTPKQETVRKFIAKEIDAGRPCPTHREIASHIGFASSYAAAFHVKALIRKGVLVAEEGKARALRIAQSFSGVPRPATAEIPLYGSIPAGFGEEQDQEANGCVIVDIASIGFKPTRNTFALRVRGDSMTGKFICDGDVVILEHGPEPRNGEVVAALVDRKTTLKTFVQKGSKRFLKAENPKYPNIIPAEELVIQGVFKALIRKA